MKKNYYLFFLFTLFISTVRSDCHDDRRVLRFSLQPEVYNPNYAGNVIGEIGDSYWRINGTFGSRFCNTNRVKVSSEYLDARNEYCFSDFSKRAWLQQIAFGALYEKMLCGKCLLSYDIGFTYSHAFGKGFKHEDTKHYISSSNYYGVSAGGNLITPLNGLLYAYLTYDYVDYPRKINSDHEVDGLGLGFVLSQPINDCFEAVIKGDHRQPYNYIEGLLNWHRSMGFGLTKAGVFISHTNGRFDLKNETRYGIKVGLDFGRLFRKEKCKTNYVCDARRRFCNMGYWVSSPAVYRPRVMAIADEEKCVPPEIVAIPDQPLDGIGQLDMTLYIEGDNIVWSVENFNSLHFALNPSIDENTGELSWVTIIFPPNSNSTTSFDVVATNECGSVRLTLNALRNASGGTTSGGG